MHGRQIINNPGKVAAVQIRAPQLPNGTVGKIDVGNHRVINRLEPRPGIAQDKQLIRRVRVPGLENAGQQNKMQVGDHECTGNQDQCDPAPREPTGDQW